MRVLLDENLPVELATALTGHRVDTVSGLGWEGVTNGELLSRMAGRFDALLPLGADSLGRITMHHAGVAEA